MGIDRLNMEVNDQGTALPNGHTVDGIHIGLGVTMVRSDPLFPSSRYRR